MYDFSVKTSNGQDVSLSAYKGNVLLIVNTATKCGFASQFAGLEKLYNDYKEKGFYVLGFPSNQFLNQEPVADEDMEQVCKINFGVTFPLFAKTDVKGKHANPLFNYLKAAKKGMLSEEIKWNFTKFLVNRKGEVIKRYAPATKPETIEADVIEELKADA